MGCWNHRVRKIQYPDGYIEYNIVEAHYKSKKSADNNKQYAYTMDAIEPYGSTLDELRWVLERMLKALDKPIIDETGGNKRKGKNARKITENGT